jgi:cobalt-zinc-cadmium efflux system membrane fusion protein
VVASPDGQALLAARADGAVVRLFKRVGEPVAAGQTLALIESREAGTIAADRASASAKVTAARQAFAREKRLFEAKITARQDYEAAQAELSIAEAELRRATSAAGAAGVTANGRQIAVTSPISGRVTAAPATLGAFVTAGTELFRIADPRRLEVQASIPGQDAARIAPGDRAQLETTSGETLPAVVRAITPGLDAESRAATAVLTLGGGAARLQPGQSLRVRIVGKGDAVAGRIVVPEAAIQSVDGQPVVFVRTKTGFAPRAVVVGSRGGGQAELLEGLKPGEEIAGEGAFVLKAELAKGEAEHED